MAWIISRGARMTQKAATVEPLIVRLAMAAVAAQRTLDSAHVEDLARLARAVDPAVLTAPPAANLLPPRPVLNSVEINARAVAARRRSAGVSIGVEVLGRPVHSFLSRRFEAEQRAASSIAVEVSVASWPAGRAASETRSSLQP